MLRILNQYSKIVAYRAGEESALFKKLTADIVRKKRLALEIKSSSTDKKRKNKIKFFYRSFPVCKCAIIEAAQKKNVFYTPEEIDELASDISKNQNISEPIYVRSESKIGGGSRIISSPGIKRKAIQIITRDVLKILDIGHESDGVIQGGRDGKISDLISSINKNNCPLVVLSDIKDFYGSIEHSEVRNLLHLFPKDVVEFCVLNNKKHKLTFSSHSYTKDDYSQLKQKVWQGLPQGSNCSVRIASALFGNLIEGLAEPDRMVWHGDDLAICASNSCEADSIKAALINRCKMHSAGPFCLKFIEVKSLHQSFVFLGYRIKYSTQTFGQFAMACPPKKAFERFFDRLNSKLMSSSDSEVAAVAWKASRNWLAGYSLWKIPYKGKKADQLEWRIPHRGLLNLVLQIQTIIEEEFNRRAIYRDMQWLTELQIDGLLAKFGHQDFISETPDIECDSFTQHFNFLCPHPVANYFLGLKIPSYITNESYMG